MGLGGSDHVWAWTLEGLERRLELRLFFGEREFGLM